MGLGETYTPGFRQAYPAPPTPDTAYPSGNLTDAGYVAQATAQVRDAVHMAEEIASRLAYVNDRILGPDPVDAACSEKAASPRAEIDALGVALIDLRAMLRRLSEEVSRTQRL